MVKDNLLKKKSIRRKYSFKRTSSRT